MSAPDPHDSVARGKYLATIAGCAECHTPMNDKHERMQDRLFAGGWEMKLPFGRVVSANITPAEDTWMGQATREEFIGRFKAFENLQPAPATKGRNTVMGWYEYAGMTEEDLGSIYDYLKTVKPIAGVVDPYPDAL